ncbi:MAG: hypothetical protein R2849_04995 [Thermomicrobiales bacterium]
MRTVSTSISRSSGTLFATTGRPITEAYWAGSGRRCLQNVLMQCFDGLPLPHGQSRGLHRRGRQRWPALLQLALRQRSGDGSGNNGETETPVETATKYAFARKFGLPAAGIQISKPNDVAASPSGDVYMTDTTNRRILKFDSKGIFVTAWGSEGTGNGQFKAPRGIAVDSQGYVYVADKSVNRIQKFDGNGAFVLAFGTTGSGNGELSSPHDIGIGPNDEVYVSDQGNNRVQIFSPSGVYTGQFGSEGSGNGQLKAAWHRCQPWWPDLCRRR